jgi:3-deoxy-manno-octulosonate cytidylyltransferase (CMP-KDO synthetase)
MNGPAVGRYAIIIPARYESTRFPGKPLAALRGVSGIAKPLIQRSWEAAAEICNPANIWVATDDCRIADAVEKFGGQIAMTPKVCRNGTERCAAALDSIGNEPEIIVNFQGDAPLTPGPLVRQLVGLLANNSNAAMATPAIRCSRSTYDHLAADSAAGRVGGTTVVFDRSQRALYFSKRIIPYLPPDLSSPGNHVHLHLGLYAYRRDALLEYAAAPPCSLEVVEGLEQLRFLDQGKLVQILPVDPVGWDCIELNNPSDVGAIEAVLAARGIE